MDLNVVIIILYDSAKRFLLQHRTDDAEILPGSWAFFGGGIDACETPIQALYRETIEELDYTLKFPELVLEQDFTEAGKLGHMCVYIEKFEGRPQELKLLEGQGWGWYKESEIGGLKMIERDREIIRQAKTFLENKEKK